MTRSVFVHIHIPRTGGTSFARIMKDNFGAAYVKETCLLVDKDTRYTAAQFDKVLRLHPQLRAYSYHQVTLDLPWHDYDITAIAFVRRPHDRLQSLYHYCRRPDVHDIPEAKCLSLDQFVRWLGSGGGLRLTHLSQHWGSQCAYLGWPATSLYSLRELIAEQRLLLFPLERFEDACLCLERWDFTSRWFRNCALAKRLNVGSPYHEPSANATRAMNRLIANTDDIKLYELAESCIGQMLDALYPKDSDLKSARHNYRQRCKRKRMRDRLVRIKRRLLA